MKTAIVTWITYRNYGTGLQAYALQTFLRENGYDNDIISDMDILSHRKKSNKFKIYKKGDLSHPWRVFLRFYYYEKEKEKIKKAKSYFSSQRRIQEFRKSYLSIASGYNCNNIASINDKYDAVICGSDQIWSVFDKNFNGYYYLDFVTVKKIAYACSVGTDVISYDKRKIILEWLGDYSAISVREKKTSVQLSELTGKTIQWVCDPTLLFESTFWSNVAVDCIEKREYLLCYFLEDREWYFERAREYARNKHLKIVLIPSLSVFSTKKIYQPGNIGELEFVGLFKNAAAVMTDSYHGSIFSLIFNKEFIYLKRFNDDAPNCQNIRIYSLFSYLQIEDRICSESDSIFGTKKLDYVCINDLIESMRNWSKAFLLEALEG